ncbi:MULTISPECIES: hypothetical protein [unclassified Luteimonas]
MEEEIKNYLKQSFLSLIPGSRRRHHDTRSHAAPAQSITRIQAGIPQAHSTPAHVKMAYRRRRSLPGYTHASYLSRPLRDSRAGQPMFRIS